MILSSTVITSVMVRNDPWRTVVIGSRHGTVKPLQKFPWWTVVACGRGLNRNATVTESCSGSVSVIIPGFPSMFVDNLGSFLIRKLLSFSFNWIKFSDLKVCDFWSIPLPIPHPLPVQNVGFRFFVFSKLSLGSKSLFVNRIYFLFLYLFI